jgi:hypothetical protein
VYSDRHQVRSATPCGKIRQISARFHKSTVSARRSSTDITQSARTDPINLPALIVAVIVVVPERVAESEPPEATMMREPPARAAEAMAAEPAAEAAEMSCAQRPTEVRAATRMHAAQAATKVAATEVATTDPAHVTSAHSAAEMAPTHSTAEMTSATPTTASAAARPCVGCDAGASHRYGHGDHRDFVQCEYPHDSFLSFG